MTRRGMDMSSIHLPDVLDFLKKRGYRVGNDEYQLAYVTAMVDAISKVIDDKHPARGSEISIFVNAPSGTGKTSLSTLVGAYAVDRELLDRIIYIRAEIEVAGEQRGFLPGDDDNKNKPFQAPFIDALDEFKPGTYDTWSGGLNGKDPKAIATHPGHFRGITKSRTFCIVDEAQNVSMTQLMAIYTRFKQDAVIVTIGHSKQCDIPKRQREYHDGLLPFEVYARHHAKEGAWIGELCNNYRGPFAMHSDAVQVTIDELDKEAFENG